MKANSSMICLYWTIGKAILEKQEEERWEAKVINRMAKDLKEAFPDMSGFPKEISSICANLPYAGRTMKLCNGSWHNFHVEQTGHYLINWIQLRAGDGMLQKVIDNGWSRNVLEHQIDSGLYNRQGKADSNFQLKLSEAQSDLAQQTLKDPYVKKNGRNGRFIGCSGYPKCRYTRSIR